MTTEQAQAEAVVDNAREAATVTRLAAVVSEEWLAETLAAYNQALREA